MVDGEFLRSGLFSGVTVKICLVRKLFSTLLKTLHRGKVQIELSHFDEAIEIYIDLKTAI